MQSAAQDGEIPKDVFLIGDIPHDWLFKQVSCVVHHGGAGTTAAGIAQGRPTVVIPFFGDQMFWGAMVAIAGAGPTPVPYKELTSARLATAIMEALTSEALQKALELAASMSKERGAEAGAESFHRHLNTVTCDLIPTRIAVWQTKREKIKLSAFAAFGLCVKGLINVEDLILQVRSLLEFTKLTSCIAGSTKRSTTQMTDLGIQSLEVLLPS
jgi:UDP-glucoronosyl and UDP-glucosyl transferase